MTNSSVWQPRWVPVLSCWCGKHSPHPSHTAPASPRCPSYHWEGQHSNALLVFGPLPPHCAAITCQGPLKEHSLLGWCMGQSQGHASAHSITRHYDYGMLETVTGKSCTGLRVVQENVSLSYYEEERGTLTFDILCVCYTCLCYFITWISFIYILIIIIISMIIIFWVLNKC